MTDEEGGLTTRDSLMVQELVTDQRAAPKISVYDKETIDRVTADAPANGYTFLMMPAFSEVHLAYGKDAPQDRKSTRLNSSHSQISHAVFCLKTNKLAH